MISVVFDNHFYAKIALPLRCDRSAVTVESRRHYGVTVLRLHRNGNSQWQKTARSSCQEAEGYPFSALFAPVVKC